MSTLTMTAITIEDFNEIVSRYASAVPEKLRELDTFRYDTVPTTLAQRAGSGDAHLQKHEVEKLVEWKLKHGTFRPKLLQLVQSNSDSLIASTTRESFRDLDMTSQASVSASVKSISALRGIGPATASLLLSVYAPHEIPFFSDELFRWCTWEDDGKPAGWKRTIKYSLKEYHEVFKRVGELRQRLGVAAVDAERVAWVLGKEAIDIAADTAEDVGEGQGEETEAEQKKEDRKTEKGVKRKIEEKPLVEGTRRSSRRKMEG
ncbi:hypothetical protein EJ04DRAFT_510404 [Polyplosphaeria fusca]|uniref:Uncharacterized protein n=1 Tax=Polyplosphaeria fusca TaxID=682080 RepID=A0A9P4R5Y5_9PLEO|nr:hypothetical protein EJ04DRAFT_510404 [Polyplosphaeria fusca]